MKVSIQFQFDEMFRNNQSKMFILHRVHNSQNYFEQHPIKDILTFMGIFFVNYSIDSSISRKYYFTTCSVQYRNIVKISFSNFNFFIAFTLKCCVERSLQIELHARRPHYILFQATTIFMSNDSHNSPIECNNNGNKC